MRINTTVLAYPDGCILVGIDRMLGRCNGVQRQVAVGEFSRTATSTEQRITDMDIWIWASGQWGLTSRFTYMRAISVLLLNTTLINDR